MHLNNEKTEKTRRGSQSVQKGLSGFVAPGVVVILLAGIAVDRMLFHLPTGDPGAYHERIREEASRIPYRIGDWVGTDVDVPAVAVALLKPNVLLNRRFQNARTGRRVSLLVVQCGDARDLLGHYPPVCYVTNGWIQRSAVPRDWEISDLTIRGVEYEFAKSSLESSLYIVIDNFMVLPDGTMARDMEAVGSAAEDVRKKIYGAAQIQLVFDGAMPSDEREKALHDLLEANIAILKAILSGAQS